MMMASLLPLLGALSTWMGRDGVHSSGGSFAAFEGVVGAGACANVVFGCMFSTFMTADMISFWWHRLE
jgi:tetrahydromethanopterin S-methyltransferase subunit B